MPRSEARVGVDIWAPESDFTDLDSDAQWMYFFLLSQPDLSHAGVLALRERRWSRNAADLDVPTIQRRLEKLAHHRYIVVDVDTEEVLVRSLIRRDKVYRQPNVLRAALDQLQLISSTIVRQVLAQELRRVQGLEMPETSVPIVAEMLAVLADTPAPDPSGKGSPKGSETSGAARTDDDTRPSMPHEHDDTTSSISADRKGSANPSGKAPSRAAPARPRTPYPVPPSPTQEQTPLGPPTAKRSAPTSGDGRRGTRLPDNFEPTDEMKAWARKDCPLTTYRDHEMFVDHWRAQTGQRAVKRDWIATWRNWMRRTQENRERTSNYQRSRPAPVDKMAQADAVADRLEPLLLERKAIGA